VDHYQRAGSGCQGCRVGGSHCSAAVTKHTGRRRPAFESKVLQYELLYSYFNSLHLRGELLQPPHSSNQAVFENSALLDKAACAAAVAIAAARKSSKNRLSVVAETAVCWWLANSSQPRRQARIRS
jgi:hypothetical protein